MDATLQLMETQKAREALWVQDGVDRFNAHCAHQVVNETSAATPKGREIMRLCHARLVERLTRYMAETGAQPHAAKDELLPVLALLGPQHVAAVTIFLTVNAVLTALDRGDHGKPQDATTKAQALGEALEYDIHFRLMSKDKESEHKRTLAWMKKGMEGSPAAWRRRARKLRDLCDEPWGVERVIVVGMDLLGLLVEACPDVISAPLVKWGGKTLRVLKLANEDITTALMERQSLAAVASPKWGMMIVRPRRWAYVEKEAA